MASITLNNITKRYGNSESAAVNDFSLHIEEGQFVVLVGPSGCGKTTALRMIAGLESISGGELLINGTRANSVSPKDRNIAMVFQNYALYPHMDAYKNMEFGLKMRKVSKQERHETIHRTAELLQIEGLLERKPAQMSGGERQRVALGRAMVRNPEVFLFDEPLSNLDAALRTEMRYNIMKLHKQLGSTFIYVTHDQIEAMTMADRIVVMNKGGIEQTDTPERIYNCPVNRFVAEFIGTPKMNMIPAVIEESNGWYDLRIGEARYDMPKRRFQSDELANYVNRQVVAGFRTEDVKISESEKERARIELVETAGPETFVHLKFQGSSIIARQPGLIDLLAQKETGIDFDMRHVHIFDAETSERLSG